MPGLFSYAPWTEEQFRPQVEFVRRGVPLYSGGTNLAELQRKDPMAATRAYWEGVGLTPTHAYVAGVPVGIGGVGGGSMYGGALGMLAPGATPGTPDVFQGGAGGISPVQQTTSGGGTPTYGGFVAGGTSGFSEAIAELLRKGLVPDIARQSAEVSAGRGIAGSPGGYSTAVRMSEQDYLQRLGLANTLASGEAGRILPYQITPYQQQLLELQRQQLQLQRELGLNRAFTNVSRGFGQGYRGGYGGGGYGSGIGAPAGGSTFGGGGFTFPGYGGGTLGGGSSLYGGGGGLGGGGNSWTLDDAMEWLGQYDVPGDTYTDYGQYPLPPDDSEDWFY